MNRRVISNSLRQYGLLLILTLMPVVSVQADWSFFKDIFSGESSDSSSAAAGLSQSDLIEGLKQALSVSAKNSVQSLGKVDGFFTNPKVKIPMPDSLQSVESGLRKLKQDELADEFILTMNRAAEQAVPETVNILTDAIKQMSISDAKGILNGPDDAATEYFRRSSGQQLLNKIRPIVEIATNKTGVTKQYKSMINNLGFMKNLIDTESLDLDQYVTEKTVDGLFSILAEEEKLIRTNPAARTTELLQKVFSK